MAETHVSPLMIEVDASDLDALYETLETYKSALADAQEEISELSNALVVMEEEMSRAEENKEQIEDRASGIEADEKIEVVLFHLFHVCYQPLID